MLVNAMNREYIVYKCVSMINGTQIIGKIIVNPKFNTISQP